MLNSLQNYSNEITNTELNYINLIDKINAGDRSVDPRAFLILDDCLYDNTWAKDKNMRSVFMNGRHYKLLFLLKIYDFKKKIYL